MKTDVHKFIHDMHYYMDAVGLRGLYREGTQMYDHYNKTVERIEDEWKEIIEEYVVAHSN